MKRLSYALAVILALVGIATPSMAAEKSKEHHIVFQVDQNDPAVMNLVLNNVQNMLEYYNGKGEPAKIEVVAFGPGLNMLRDDKSPVKDRIAEAKAAVPNLALSMCNNAKMAAEKREGITIKPMAGVKVVPAGIVRLMELQELGWTYIRP